MLPMGLIIDAAQKMYSAKKVRKAARETAAYCPGGTQMTPYITRALAQQIVDSVRDLCGQNVNFIDCSGTIFASTDESRIGTFHEIGREATASGSVIEVRENDQFTGTQQGRQSSHLSQSQDHRCHRDHRKSR